MSAENDNQPRGPRLNVNVEEAREKAREALRKSEFILSRAYGLLREPKKEWVQIRDEETTIPSILLGYVAPLAAIPPVCSLIGAYVFEPALAGDIGTSLVRTVVTWIISVAIVFLLGFIVNAIAENFDGDRDELRAQKLAAYSMTPAFLSGVFSLWPPLWWLSLFMLAAMVFLIYRGLPILMRCPPERAMPYTATVTIATFVSVIVLFSLATCVS